MPVRDLLTIPVPRGRSGNTGYLSIFFAPRLFDAGTISGYADWNDWPAFLTALKPTISVGINGAVRGHTVVGLTQSSAKWRAIFPTTTPVTPWRFVDRTQTPVVSYDQLGMAAGTADVYAHVLATYPTPMPTTAALMADPVVNGLLKGPSSPVPSSRAFFDPVATTSAGKAPESDFHAALAMLWAHPELLRLLGLVVDVEVSLPAAAPTSVRVQTNYAGIAGFGAGRTEVRFDVATASDFWPAPNTDPALREQVSGWMDLSTKWEICEIDALNAARRLGPLADGDNTGTGLPVQDERGISLMRSRNVDAISAMWARQKIVQRDIDRMKAGTIAAVPMFAEDITVGQRIDVRDDVSNTWRSVFERQTTGYRFPRAAAQNHVPAPDEGWTQFTLSSEGEERYLDPPEGPRVPTTVQRIQDSLFTWQGWSAVSAVPGRVVAEDGSVVAAPVPNSSQSPHAKLEVTYTPKPGTLPRLRYHRTYEMRARPVYLGGASRARTEVEPAAARSNRLKYGRTAPAAPPEVVRAVNKPVPGTGEAIDTIVLLGDYNLTPAQVASQARVLLPPAAPQGRVEVHDLPNGGADPASYNLLATRDALSVSSQCTPDPVSSDLVSRAALGLTPPVQYLAEPPVAGVALTPLPGASDVTQVPWVGTWPSGLRATRMVVQSGVGAPTVTNTATGATLRVLLPQATDTVVELSSTLKSSFLADFAYWNALSSAQQTSLLSSATKGRLWLLSAPRTLRLIHAVRRPMVIPTVQSMAATRPELGSRTVEFDATLTADPASTEILVVTARFTDDIDDPNTAAPTTQTSNIVLGRFTMDRDPSATPMQVVDALSETQDQKHHVLEVEVEAISRFANYFTEQRAVTFTTATVVLDADGLVPDTVEASSDRQTWRSDGFTVNADAGSVTRQAGGWIAAGATVTFRYLARPVSRFSTEGGVARTRVSVPASRAPAVPVVLDAVPATAVTETRTATSVTRVRTGSMVRVWTDRGWFTSGSGELLGVVTDATARAVPNTTRYGRDPLRTRGAARQPLLTDFRRATATRRAAATGLDVAAHAIGFDAASGRWYSDIELDLNAVGYRPFVRLTVARYQPNALAGAMLSSRVDLDPLRLGVSRTSRVVRNANASLTITVQGREGDGVPDESAGNTIRFNTVTAQLQRPDAAITDPDLRWSDVGAPITLTRARLADGSTRWSTTTAPITGVTGTVRVILTEFEPVMIRNGETGVVLSANEIAVEDLTFTL